MKKRKLDLNKMRQEFTLNVDSTAEYTPNADEFYSRAFLANNIEDFRVKVGVKDSEKIGRLSFGNDSILREFQCGWDALNMSLDAKTIDVVKITVPHQVCQSELEESFAVLEMTKGQEGWKTANMFWAHYMDILAKRISEDLALATWVGQSGGTLATLTGFESLIAASTDTVEVTFTGTAYTVANVEDAFEDLLTALPNTIARAKNDLRFYVSPATMNAIMISMSKNNTQFYATKELDPMYAGIKISEQAGMSGDMIVLTRKENLVIGVDAELDEKNIKVRDLDVINEPVIRTRVDFNYGNLLLNDEEIYYTVVAV